MEYKGENDTILKGFSQVDLDILNENLKVNNQLLKRQTIVFGIIAVIVIVIILWGLWQVKHYKIVTLLIKSLRGG